MLIKSKIMDKPQFTEVLQEVNSSNLDKIGHQKNFGPNGEDCLRVVFKRGATYDYFPVSEEEYRQGLAADEAMQVSEWFKKIKETKQFRPV